ncbi:EAL domain-containing protein [Aromatoleum evansii]|uniref:EAL domain-containing protein n=1 Tax=Aromatoleum evansii TaxID=59406 RepID=UPI00145E0FFA|nr:EAL domain-containing protein [Aromatoleum evansii]NMG27696.1 EAL domain-containing protein [Aromatoleum evansii]
MNSVDWRRPDRLHASVANLLAGFVLVLAAAVASLHPGIVRAQEGAGGGVADDAVEFAVLSFSPLQETHARWQPLVDYLNGTVEGARFVLRVHHLDELVAALADGRIDFVLVNPALYVQLTYEHHLSSPLVTLVNKEDGVPVSAFGGVIFTRADRSDIDSFDDVGRARVATAGRAAFGAYQMQVAELLRAGVRPPQEKLLVETGQPQSRAIDAVLDGRADVGFVRSGLIESLTLQGRLDPAQLKLIGTRQYPGYPFPVSTRLYPEWPVVAMPQVPHDLARRVTAALLALPHDGEVADTLQISGFTIPGDYRPVDDLLRGLRLPPFDRAPEFTFVDVWRRWKPYAVALLLAGFALAAFATFRLVRINRRLARAQQESQRLAANLSQAQSVAQIGSWNLDVRSGSLLWSDETYRLFGVRPGTPVTYEDFLQCVHPDDRDVIDRAWQAALKGAPYDVEHRILRNGGVAWLQERADLRRDTDGKLVGAIGTVQDVTARKLADEELRKLSLAVEQSPECIFITDPAGTIEYVNDALVRITGFSREEVLGRNPRIFKSGKTPNETFREMWLTLQRGEIWQGEIVNLRRDGSEIIEYSIIAPVRETDGTVSHYLAIQQDITERKQAAERIHHLAFYDELTGLPNRSLLIDRLTQVLASRQHQGYREALLLFNIDRFQVVNDARGSVLGDALLKAVAARLREVVREGDTVARMAGDEFALMLPVVDRTAEAASRHALQVARKIQSTLETPFELGGETVRITGSIGITLFPEEDSDTASEILRRATTALHRAKQGGGGHPAFFEASMGKSAAESFRIERELRAGIPRGELRLFLQPQFSAAGEVVGAEALVRWQHPERGLVPPGVFVPVAEESDLIVELGVWVMNEACRLVAVADAAGLPLALSVNISPRHFRKPEFNSWVRSVLDRTGAPPERLTLEITEGLIIDNVSDVVAKMRELSALGIHFSIDDFGTGYSSLAYLKRLPIDELKIDKTFVQDAPHDPSDAALVETILAVARQLQLKVVAEGVETAEQAEFLNSRGEVVHQGYLFGRPAPADEWLARWAADAGA